MKQPDRPTDERDDAELSEGERLLHEPPTFDEDEGLDDYDKTVADSFPASDPPGH